VGLRALHHVFVYGHFFPDDRTMASSTRFEEEQGSCEDLVRLLGHDLRSPLTTIRVACDLLANGTRRTDKRAIEYIQLIRHAVAQIESMSEDMIGLAHAPADADALCSATTVLTEVLDDHRPMAQLNGIAFHVQTPEHDCAVCMDRANLRRVLANLITNALRFTPRGGTVRVRAEQTGDEIRFEVADTGAGIPPDDLPHVFHLRWHQRRDEGTRAGLGLALVRTMVAAHDGRIEVSSRVGAGSTFAVVLPVATPV
jgi:signal transduction histidine kinase